MATNGVSKDVGVERLWEHADPKSTAMWKFMQDVNTKYDLKLDSYDDLHTWSVNNISKFWGEVWETTSMKASRPYKQVNIITNPAQGSRNSVLSTPDRSSMNQLQCSHAPHGSQAQNSISQRISSFHHPRRQFSNPHRPSSRQQRHPEQQSHGLNSETAFAIARPVSSHSE